MKYKTFKSLFVDKVENDELWKILIEELDKVDDELDVEELCAKMGIQRDNSLINRKGTISFNNGIFYLKTDKTDSVKVQRFTIAHEIGHAILHFNCLKNGVILESDYIENEISHTRYEIEANQFAAAILIEDESFIEKLNDLIINNKSEGKGTVVHDVTLRFSKLYNVSEMVIENKLKTLGYIK